MRDGEIRTDTIAGLDVPGPPIPGPEHWQAAARLVAEGSADPWADGWRLNGPPVRRIRHGDEERAVPIDGPPPSVAAARDGSTIHVDVDGQSVEFGVAEPPSVESAAARAAAGVEGASVLVAPMPGRVIAVRATAGDAVRAGQVIAVIEAMKMEHVVAAPIPGTIAELRVRPAEQVARGDLLAIVEP